MDGRVPLGEHTALRVHSREGGEVRYTIDRELGRGGSCIVYAGSYVTNAGAVRTVRIKECYPYGMALSRGAGGELAAAPESAGAFRAALDKFWEDFRVSSGLFYAEGLSDALVNTLDIYGANGTAYVVSAYAPEETLAAWQPESLKDCVSVVENVAQVIARIHRAGYLYLDCKPENVLVIRDPVRRVLLFDFDTLVPRDMLSQEAPGARRLRLSYSPGYAPLELRLGQWRRLGPWTDVYGLGALLFQLLFGRTPEASDCEPGARYSFGTARYAGETYQDRLFPALEAFFHRALANYAPDRYQEMEEAASALGEIARLADTEIPFVLSTLVLPPGLLLGREEELAALTRWSEGPGNCLFVTGMGGIGKSTLVRGFLAAGGRAFDTILYLGCAGGIRSAFIDDSQLFINTVERSAEETPDQYFRRKLRYLRRLCRGKRTVIALDDCRGPAGEELLPLLNPDWKLLVVTRRDPPAHTYEVLRVEAMGRRQDLRALVAAYLGRQPSDEELPCVDDLIAAAAGHTLALELMARQIAGSFLSLREARLLAKKHGFSSIAPEKVGYVKDQVEQYGTILSLVGALFDAGGLSPHKRTILKALSLFGPNGVDAGCFQSLLEIPTRDEVGELCRDGWVRTEGGRLSLHPVIGESVRSWAWNGPFRDAVGRVMAGLLRQVRQEHPEEAFPPANGERVRQLVRLSGTVLDSCEADPALFRSEICAELRYRTTMALPECQEEDLLRGAAGLLDGPPLPDPLWRLNLCDRVAAIYEARGELDMARKLLADVKRTLPRLAGGGAWGRYYDMLAGFYEAKLEGYGDEDPRCLALLLDALEKAARCLRRAEGPGNKRLLAECLLSRATVLTRSAPQKAGTIDRLFRSAWELVKQCTGPGDESRLGYHMSRAWYYTLAAPDFGRACAEMDQAHSLAGQLRPSGLEEIDTVVIPTANILLTWGRCRQAADWLESGVRTCEEAGDIVPFVRKKSELLRYLLDVWREAGDGPKCREMLDRIERENAADADLE